MAELPLFGGSLPSQVSKHDSWRQRSASGRTFSDGVWPLSNFGSDATHPMTALRDLSILDELALAKEYAFLREGKKTLKNIAYLNYRRHRLTPVLKEL